MFKVLVDGCEPTKGSKFSAAIDLYTSEDVVIGAGDTKLVGLGVCIDDSESYQIFIKDIGMIHDEEDYIKWLESHYLQLEPRSSLRAKGLQAGTGIIDLDYKDEIKIILHNPIKAIKQDEDDLLSEWLNQSIFKIKKGDKIAQIMLCEHKTNLLGVESEDERVGGFGSTDENNKL